MARFGALLGEGPAQSCVRIFLRTVVLPAQRGTIYDRDGEILAHDQPNFEVYVTPAEVENLDQLIERMRPILDLDELAWFRMNEKLSMPRGIERHRAIKVARDLTRRQVAQLESMRSEQSGISIQIRYQRVYPQKGVGAHLIGYLGKPTAAELRADSEGDIAGFNRGRYGLERKFEADLSGQDGFARFVVNAQGGREKGQWVSTAMADIANRRSARRGDDLVLTIDIAVQSIPCRP